MKRYTAEELKKNLELHIKWLNGESTSPADLSYADLSGADLRDADLRGANLRYASLRGANLRYASLRGASLRDADLRDADLSGANLRYADLRGADLGYAELSYADLRDADLSGADLRDADLSDADLRGADLSYADLRDADLRGINGNLKHIKSLQTEIYYITYTAKVIQIACQRHTIEQWNNFNDDDILKMDGQKALDWWNKWKPILMQIIKMAPCEETR